jgi:internalin A
MNIMPAFSSVLLRFGLVFMALAAGGCSRDESTSTASQQLKEMGAEVNTDMNGDVMAVRFGQLAVEDDVLSQLHSFDGLQEVYLHSEKISDAGLAHLAQLKNLRKVSVQNAQITDSGVESLKSLSSLNSLDLSGCSKITDEAMDDIATLTNLEELDLTGTGLSSKGMEELENLTKLRDLKIGASPIDATGLGHLTALSNLQSLSLTDLDLTADDVEKVAELNWLLQLRLHDCSLTDQETAPLARLDKMTKIDLSQNAELTDKGIEFLKNMPDLLSLDISETNVTGEVFSESEPFQKLIFLNMRGTPVSDAQAGLIGELKELHSLNVSDTSVTDEGAAVIQKAIGDKVTIVRESIE